jgi:hypothetical protein
MNHVSSYPFYINVNTHIHHLPICHAIDRIQDRRIKVFVERISNMLYYIYVKGVKELLKRNGIEFVISTSDFVLETDDDDYLKILRNVSDQDKKEFITIWKSLVDELSIVINGENSHLCIVVEIRSDWYGEVESAHTQYIDIKIQKPEQY